MKFYWCDMGFYRFLVVEAYGEVAERFKAHAWKAC